ncbi:roundabout homolog 2-like [Amphiura filiformis]|uniref:roundabout homolog 2-like n=1 Tax=Amphiura filiformis TaxID=82378 RepID=UPI003B2252C4
MALYETILTKNFDAQQQAFSLEPSDTTATEGSALTLFCTVSDRAGIVTWIKGASTPISVNDRIIDTSNTRFSITGDLTSEFNLRITNANLTDAGAYTCQVSAAGSSSEIVSQPATVTILNVQKFTNEPADTTGAGDSTVTLMCQVSNKEGFLSWRRDGTVISNETRITNSNPRFSIVGDRAAGEYNLQIIAAQESDEGIYECFVTAHGSSRYIESRSAFLSVISSGSQRLTIVPSDTIATEGTTTQMRCKVADKAGVLSWLQNGQAISFDNAVSLADERYSIVGNNTEGEFYLQISDLGEDDQGTYHCIVNAEGNNDAISSSGANLIIRPAESPDAIYPQCFMTPSGDLQEGDNVTLSCLSRGGAPQPELFWLKDGQDFTSNMVQFSSYTRNDVNIVLNNDLIGTVFECQATHPAYSSTKVCTLDPLIFELVPTINVELDTEILKILEKEAGSVICSATGDPTILGYAWYYNGVEIIDSDQRFVIETSGSSQSTLTITSASLSMDESVISCEARNRIDAASVYTVVRIEEDNLFTYILAVLALVGFFVLCVIIIPCIFYYCWKKQNKLNKIRPHDDSESVSSVSKLVQQNYFTEEETRAMPNGSAKKKPKKGSTVISHESEGKMGVPPTVVLRGGKRGSIRSSKPGSARRVSAFQDLYPPEPAMSPVMMNGKKASYDVTTGKLMRNGSILSSKSLAYANNSYGSRRTSFAPSMANGAPPGKQIDERKARELENMRSLANINAGFDINKERRTKKHRSKDEKKHKHKHREHKHDKKSRDHKDKKSKHRKDKH